MSSAVPPPVTAGLTVQDFQGLEKGRYRARLAETDADLRRVRALRSTCFRYRTGEDDELDQLCGQVLVEDRQSGAVRCCFRMLGLVAADLQHSYAARFYDLRALAGYSGRMLELGRFCSEAGQHDPDVLRMAWAYLTRHVDQAGIDMLFGCTSFAGTDPSAYGAAFSVLRQHHAPPSHWAPRPLARETFECQVLADDSTFGPTLRAEGLRQMPPLLRSYLGMGAWVSDHGVIDRDLQTMHVFTAVEVARIPAARQRLLRSLV